MPYEENRYIRDLCHMGKTVTKDTERIFLIITGAVCNYTETHHKLEPIADVTTATTSVVYFFQAEALFCIGSAKFWPILANLGHFVVNLRNFWCTFTRRNNAMVPRN